MKFPEFVDDPKQSDTERAAARLRFLLRTVALQITGRGSMGAVAQLAGVDHSTLCYSIKRGSCTPEVALKIEDALGRDVLPNEWLRRPLEIASE